MTAIGREEVAKNLLKILNDQHGSCIISYDIGMVNNLIEREGFKPKDIGSRTITLVIEMEGR